MPAQTDREIDGPSIAALELALVLVVTVIAGSLRLAAPSHLAVEHFDEGVYASNRLADFQDPPGAYPDRHLYAPPLFPELLEWSLVIGGGRPCSVMCVNLVVGTMMTLLTWWCARDWFGPLAGLAAMILAASSDYHIAFSRMALTDTLLALWLLAAVYAGGRAVLSGRGGWLVAAGVLASLAWWTKYNGWLAIAITASGTAAWCLSQRVSPNTMLAAGARWLGTAGIAVLSWVLLRSTLPPGVHYGDITANHRRYLTGEWFNGLLQHWAAHRYLDGWSTIAGVAAAAGGVMLVRFTWNGLSQSSPSMRRAGGLAVGLVALNGGLLLGSTGVLALLAIAGICLAIRRTAVPTEAEHSLRMSDPAQATRLAGWMLAAWFAGLLLATPFYYPYPRLSLPWLVACWLGSAAALQSFAASAWFTAAVQRLQPRAVYSGAIVFALCIPAAAWCRGSPVWPMRTVPWQDHRGLARIAELILTDVNAESRPSVDGVQAVIYVYAEPALFFQMESRARLDDLPCLAHPAGNLDLIAAGPADPRVATYVAIGPHGFREGTYIDEIVARLVPVGEYPYHPSDMVRLDELPAWSLEGRDTVDESVHLYRVP